MLSDSLGWAASGISSSERVLSGYDCSGGEGEGGFIILPELETRSYPARTIHIPYCRLEALGLHWVPKILRGCGSD